MLQIEDGDRRALRDQFHGAARGPTHPPPGAADDWTIPQDWRSISAEEHDTWNLLFARQEKALAGRAVRQYFDGLDILRLSKPGIPDFAELNDRLSARTGWVVVAVPGLVPDDVFFDHLRNRRFPAGNFIRKRSQFDYLEEPDVFHDIFGHIPMLAHPEMASWVQRLGRFGLQAIEGGTLHLLARLYWRTVEFGLAAEDGSTRILGAGIVSSFIESAYALDSEVPRREPFDLKKVLTTPYRSDTLQELYFVMDDFQALIGRTHGCSWHELLAKELRDE